MWKEGGGVGWGGVLWKGGAPGVALLKKVLSREVASACGLAREGRGEQAEEDRV